MKKATPSATRAPKAAKPAKVAGKPKAAPKAKPGAKKAKTAKPAATKATEPRPDSKKAIVLALLRRPEGASLEEIAAITNWQKHSVRGFLSLLGSKAGLKVESEKTAAGRCYRIIE